jgi:hypothetical protein
MLVARYLAAIAAFLILETPGTRADSTSCLAKATSFVVQLDELLSIEKNRITPYFELLERYFPLRDCEVDALLDTARESRFIRSISYHARTKQYFVVFSSADVQASFAYLVSEKKSQTASAGFTHK